MMKIKYKTKNNLLLVELHFNSVIKKDVLFDYYLSTSLCQSGCKNFNKKHSCPPNSPPFDYLAKNKSHLSVLVVKIDTENLKKNYLSLKMINSVARSIQGSYFNYIKSTVDKSENSYFLLGNGSCRSCKVCSLITNERCKKPQSISYSLESTGIDVDKVIKNIFGFNLEWYKIFNNSFPDFQCVIGGIISNNPYLFYELLLKWYEMILLKNIKVVELNHISIMAEL